MFSDMGTTTPSSNNNMNNTRPSQLSSSTPSTTQQISRKQGRRWSSATNSLASTVSSSFDVSEVLDDSVSSSSASISTSTELPPPPSPKHRLSQKERHDLVSKHFTFLFTGVFLLVLLVFPTTLESLQDIQRTMLHLQQQQQQKQQNPSKTALNRTATSMVDAASGGGIVQNELQITGKEESRVEEVQQNASNDQHGRNFTMSSWNLKSDHGPGHMTTQTIHEQNRDTHSNGTITTDGPATKVELQDDPNTYLPTPRQPYSWSLLEDKESATHANRNRLGFLHIPKTGGSSIEHAGAAGGQTWGMCLFVSSKQCQHEKNRSIQGSLANQTVLPVVDPAWQRNKESGARRELLGKHSFPLWHLPIQHLPSSPDSAYYDANLTDPYHNQDIFAVVRNPYKRAISEYYYRCKRLSKCLNKKERDTVVELNKTLQRILKSRYKAIWSGGSARNRSSNETTAPDKLYFSGMGHWIPQYDYVFSSPPPSSPNNGNSTAPTIIRTHHLIHFEHLADEFASLMDAYHLPVSLDVVEQQLSRSNWNTQQTVADLTPRTRQMIEDIYEHDFALGGGYIMIERTKLARDDPKNRGICDADKGKSIFVVGGQIRCM